MQIFDIRRLAPVPTRSGRMPVARFNVQVTPDLTLFDLHLQRGDGGRYLLYPPFGNSGGPTSSMSPALRAEIIAQITYAMEDAPHDRHAA